jgi:single-strand DNA-binding protein
VKRTVFELDVEEVAPSLKNATAKVTKSSGNSGQRNGQARQAQGSGDPWGAAAQQAGQAAGSGWGGDEPPF